MPAERLAPVNAETLGKGLVDAGNAVLLIDDEEHVRRGVDDPLPSSLRNFGGETACLGLPVESFQGLIGKKRLPSIAEPVGGNKPTDGVRANIRGNRGQRGHIPHSDLDSKIEREAAQTEKKGWQDSTVPRPRLNRIQGYDEEQLYDDMTGIRSRPGENDHVIGQGAGHGPKEAPSIEPVRIAGVPDDCSCPNGESYQPDTEDQDPLKGHRPPEKKVIGADQQQVKDDT